MTMSAEKHPSWHASTLLCGEAAFFGNDERALVLQRRFGLPAQQLRDLPCKVLYPSRMWSEKEAQRKAFKLVEAPAAWRVIVLLGGKTKTAFGYYRPFFSHETSSWNCDVQLVALPSPGDRSWRNTRLAGRARQLLREVIPSVPWGTLDDPFNTLGFALRCAAECALWKLAIPAALQEHAPWTDDEFMVAMDATEAHGLDRLRGEYLARVGGKGAAA
jgi:hypothetical protein